MKGTGFTVLKVPKYEKSLCMCPQTLPIWQNIRGAFSETLLSSYISYWPCRSVCFPCLYLPLSFFPFSVFICLAFLIYMLWVFSLITKMHLLCLLALSFHLNFFEMFLFMENC